MMLKYKVQISFLLILVFLKLVPQRKNLQVKNLNLYSKNFTRLLRLNETGSPVEKLAKYDGTRGDSAAEYYAEIIPPIIEKAVKNIQQYQFLSQLVEKNDSWEPVLKSRVIATLKGIDTYDQLTKSDIDELVSAFKEIQEIL